ncbi:MAG: hypothetical protein HFJ40_08265 [Clostridia bacterium]|nr:hypothetical protein [Clostridia bacterium]
MKKIQFRNPKLVFTILIALLFIIFLLYYTFVFSVNFARNSFANNMIEIAEENENSIFNIQKVLLYSSANAIDNTEEQSLQNLSISQYTDISLYIDNTSSISELTNENTIKELYIDNIFVNSNSNNGYKYLNYKNPMDFGKFKNFDAPENNRIDFNIVNTNSENENYDYSKPTFYTDCSNPITLGYMNKDLLTNYSVSKDSKSVSFNGKVLKEANIDLNDINCTLNFKIHIVNNMNQKFVYNMKLDIDLNDNNGGIYNGYVYRGKTTSGSEYRFFKEMN